MRSEILADGEGMKEPSSKITDKDISLGGRGCGISFFLIPTILGWLLHAAGCTPGGAASSLGALQPAGQPQSVGLTNLCVRPVNQCSQ